MKQPSITRTELRRQRELLAATPASNVRSPETTAAPQPATSAPAATANIMTICTGNICRSPMGEVLLRASLSDVAVRVHSAGTHALIDHEMTPQAQDLAVRLGAAPDASSAHRARWLTESMLADADLVFAMAREHRSHIVQMVPATLRRAFTVREFARLTANVSDAEIRAIADGAGDEPSARIRAVARFVSTLRGSIPAQPDDDDVVDPYRRSQNTYDRSAEQLAPAIAGAQRVIRAALS